MTPELTAIMKKSLKSNRWESFVLPNKQDYTNDAMVSRWVTEKNKWLNVSKKRWQPSSYVYMCVLSNFAFTLFVTETTHDWWSERRRRCSRRCHKRTYPIEWNRANQTRRQTHHEAALRALQRIRAILPPWGWHWAVQWNLVRVIILRRVNSSLICTKSITISAHSFTLY